MSTQGSNSPDFTAKAIYNDGVSIATATVDKESLVTHFHFPEHISAACKQYLIYFSQFLSDLGVQANTEIAEQEAGTLFKIKPLDKETSLAAIRDALDLYLRAPDSPDFSGNIDFDGDFAIAQWQANVLHLKSQIVLSKAVIQAKDATIQALETSLQLSNYQLKQAADASKESNSEDIIPGVVSVDKFKSKGVTINLAEIFRRLKRKLSGE